MEPGHHALRGEVEIVAGITDVLFQMALYAHEAELASRDGHGVESTFVDAVADAGIPAI